MAKVFISYRREDWPFAQLFAERLATATHNVDIFRDVVSIPRHGATPFPRVIKHAIQDCHVFVLIASQNSLDLSRLNTKDDWVREEISTAIEELKPIVPVILNDFEMPVDLPDDIQNIRNQPGLSFRYDDFDEKLKRFVKLCQVTLRKKNPELADDFAPPHDDEPCINPDLLAQASIVDIFSSLDDCKDELIRDFRNATEIRMFFQLGRREMSRDSDSYFYDPAIEAKEAGHQQHIRVLHTAADSPFLSETRITNMYDGNVKRAQQKLKEWSDSLTSLHRRIDEYMREGYSIDIERRGHAEPYILRMFLFDDVAYITGYTGRQAAYNAPVLKLRGGENETDHSLFKIFDLHFEYLWQKYNPAPSDPAERWQTWEL